MGYQQDRERRTDIFEDTLQYCERSRILVDAVMRTRRNTVLYREPLRECSGQERRFEEEAEVVVTPRRTLAAAKELSRRHKGQRIGVLNFASATNPGGGVIRGSNAQEECLCRSTTLYPCLNTETLRQDYYGFHRERRDTLYTDACVYLPEVAVFKTDEKWPELMPKEEWFSVDVISCAAPNLRGKLSGSGNSSAGKEKPVSEGEVRELIEKRIRGILTTAAANRLDILVLGAFGCGAFCNSPYTVAEAYQRVLKDFLHTFRIIEFAVYCPPQDRKNYDVFSALLTV
ncbi:MAG: TIGR02452 family protein [Bacteroidales bacterium]|nr:TIGR02452 family protein [Clostridium sp.]MCM1204754.1 TIGR02452 family protein [Bacteroidales bacterium]